MKKILSNSEIIEVFNNRSSIKEFDKNKVISKEDFDTILQAGILSPSSFGIEPWKFIVITNKNLILKLGELADGINIKSYGCSHIVIYLSATAKIINGEKGLFISQFRDRFNQSQDAINMRIKQRQDWQESFTDELTNEWSSKQTYIALANMLTVAALLGIDSSPIEGFNKSRIDKFLFEELDINTSEYKSSVMAVFGYRAKDPRKKLRRPITEIVKLVE